MVDVQAYRVLSGLLQLWARFPTCDPPAKLDAVLRVALDLLLSLALNVALWFSLRDQHLHHWAMALLLSIAVFVRPTLSSLRFLVVRPGGGGGGGGSSGQPTLGRERLLSLFGIEVNALRMHCSRCLTSLIPCELPANCLLTLTARCLASRLPTGRSPRGTSGRRAGEALNQWTDEWLLLTIGTSGRRAGARSLSG